MDGGRGSASTPAPWRGRGARNSCPVTLEELRRGADRRRRAPELARARAQVKAGLLMSLESTGSRCEQLARQIQVFGRVVPTAETVAKIEAVTLADVRRGGRADLPRPADPWPAMGPAEHVPGLDVIADRLAA